MLLICAAVPGGCVAVAESGSIRANNKNMQSARGWDVIDVWLLLGVV
jgi:hypothetical protein